MARSAAFEWAFFTFKVFCSAVIFFAVAFTVYTVGPVIETRYFPAVSKLTIRQLSENEDGHAVVMAEFNKLRGECEYVGIAWYHGLPGGQFERVPVVLMRRDGDDSSPNRPTGKQIAGPWVIHVPAAEIAGNSFSRLAHRCHPLWTTVTDFYP